MRGSLRKDQDIKAVFAKGRGVYDDLAGIKYCQNGLNETRFAIVVGTKVDKRAVRRNRLKRQIRAILAKNSYVGGFDVVVLTRTAAVGKEFPEIEAHLVKALQKAKLIKNG